MVRVVLALLVFAAGVPAQPILVRSSPERPATVQTFRGVVEGTATPVEPAREVTVALVMDAIDAAGIDRAKAFITTLYAAAPKRPLRIAVLSQGQLSFAGPFATRAKLAAALAEVTPNPSPYPAVHEAIVNAIPQLGGNWSPLILLGDIPAPEPVVADYTSARLLRAARQQKIRLHYWSPTGGPPAWNPGVFAATGGTLLTGTQLDEAASAWMELTWQAEPPVRGMVLSTGKSGDLSFPEIVSAPDYQLPSLAEYGALRGQMGSATDPRTLEQLCNLEPFDAALRKRFGKALYDSKDLTRAAIVLEEVRKESGVAEWLADIRLRQNDPGGALPYLDEAAAIQPTREDLWFARASAATSVKDVARMVESLERGLALAPSRLAERTALVQHYMDAKRTEDALRHVRLVAANPPPSVEARVTYAAFLDGLAQPAESLAMWRKVLELDANHEPAQYRAGRLLLDSGDLKGSLALLEKSAESPRIFLLKAEALDKQSQWHATRDVLISGASKPGGDVGVLRRHAEVEDTFGENAPRAYQALAAKQPDPEVLKRGLVVSLRENDAERARWFADALVRAGDASAGQWFSDKPGESNGAWVPGGLDALSFIARGKRKQTPDTFFAQLSRTVVANGLGSGLKPDESYFEELNDYFKQLVALEAHGKREGNIVKIRLSLKDKDSRRRTEQVLSILGIKVKTAKNEITLEHGEKKSQAQRQETTAALAIDEIGIQEAFRGGNEYTLEIPYEWAAIHPDERIWREAFFPGQKLYGGFAEAITRDLRLAKIYAGMSVVSNEAAAVLLAAVPLKQLADKYSDVFFRFSSAFAVQRGRVVVPGGESAEPAWTKLVAVSPKDGKAFFRALLDKEDGRILSFFFSLSQLDTAHQRFFTANPRRTERFYELFAASAQHVERLLRDSAFSEFLSAVPLMPDGTVNFPGSAEVWMVAKGTSSSVGNTTKMLKKVSKAVAPDQEDEILIRLARTRYKATNERRSEVDNFVAVSRIDAHRKEPLDEESALILAQHYGEAGDLYPYLTVLTSLGAGEYRKFFELTQKLRNGLDERSVLLVGQLHALIEILCLFRESEAIDEKQEVALFRYLCERYAAAAGDSDRTSAALSFVRQLPVPLKVGILGNTATSKRSSQFDGVLSLQLVPSIDLLLEMGDAASQLGAGKDPAMQLKRIEAGRAKLPVAEIAKTFKAPEKVRNHLALYDHSSLARICTEIRQKLSKKKIDPKELDKLGRQVMEALHPQTTLALAGHVYAYYLSPDDLIVSEDHLLLRKHRFFDYAADLGRVEVLAGSDFRTQVDTAGASFFGGFAQFSTAAGAAAVVGTKAGKGDAFWTARSEIGGLRMTDWSRLTPSDFRYVSLRILAGREWLVKSAVDTKLLDGLESATTGLLSIGRRAELINALHTRAWKSVWNTVTTPDLYVLGGRYMERSGPESGASPVVETLKRVAGQADSARLARLGPVSSSLAGCRHPHLQEFSPYEDFERYLLADKLSERSAEFKLYLAHAADRAGVFPAALNDIAEPLARDTLGKLHMVDGRDWRAVVAAYASVLPEHVQSRTQ